MKFTLGDLERAAAVVHAEMAPTPQLSWPLLCRRAGAEVWVKHENQTAIGAFKIRGGLNYIQKLQALEPSIGGVIAATRGNHGQSVALAARTVGLRAVVVVPHGNSAEKNAAMRAQGAELVEHGHDFTAAYEFAIALAGERNLHLFHSFHPWLVAGVASYSLELFRAVSDIHTLYVPIGLGSGICGAIAARDALGLASKIVGVVAENAATYALSFARKKTTPTNSANTIADGMAVRVPDEAALAMIMQGADRIVTVSEDEIRAAMRHYFTDTHNLAEGAGAGSLAALLKEREQMAGKRVAVVLSGGNVDKSLYQRILAESD